MQCIVFCYTDNNPLFVPTVLTSLLFIFSVRTFLIRDCDLDKRREEKRREEKRREEKRREEKRKEKKISE